LCFSLKKTIFFLLMSLRNVEPKFHFRQTQHCRSTQRIQQGITEPNGARRSQRISTQQHQRNSSGLCVRPCCHCSAERNQRVCPPQRGFYRRASHRVASRERRSDREPKQKVKVKGAVKHAVGQHQRPN